MAGAVRYRLTNQEMVRMLGGALTTPPDPPLPFEVGNTMPTAAAPSDMATERNIGLGVEGLSRGDLEPWTLTSPVNGVLTLDAGQLPTWPNVLEGYDFGNVHLRIRARAHLKNCVAAPLASNPANVDYVVQVQDMTSGVAAQHEVILENFEAHNYAQKNLSTYKGRNLRLFKSIGTGGSDLFQGVHGTFGSAPENFLADFKASLLTEAAFWITNYTTNAQTHSDCFQSDGGSGRMSKLLYGNALLMHVSEIVGTGTPGSGADVNPFAAINSAAQYQQSQATMAARRATYLNTYSDPETSFDGVSWKRGTPGVDTSMACVMLNRAPATVQKNWLSGGHAQINFRDTNIASGEAGLIIEENRMWRDCQVHMAGTTGKSYPGVPVSGPKANINDVGAAVGIAYA